MIKKITIISSYFAPAWAYGGPPKVLFILAKALVKKGIEIDVITSDSLGEKRTDKLFEEKDSIKIYRFKNLSNLLAFRTNFFYVPGLLSNAKKILNGSDVILFSDVRNIFNWRLYRYIKAKKIPYGIFAFGEIPYSGKFKSLIKKIFDIVWVKDYVQNASWRFAQTDHEREMYKKYFGIPKDKTQLLLLPIDIKKSVPNKNKIKEFKNKWQVGENDRIIIFVGRIHYLKGIDILIQAVKNLLKAHPEIKLFVVGRDDGYIESLKKIIPQDIKKQIIFTGPLYSDETNTAYSASFCFVFTPRFFEETSLAALEALSFGLPVLTVEQANIPFLESYQAGLVIKNDLESIQNGIEEIFARLKVNEKTLRLQAVKLIKEKYNVEIIANKLINFLSESYEHKN